MQKEAAEKKTTPLFPYRFDPEKRRKARAYLRARVLAGFLNGTLLPLALYTFLVLSDQHRVLARALSALTPEPLLPAAYAVVLFALTAAVRFPLAYYFGFVYEHRHRLSCHTLQSWLVDHAKSLLLGFVFTVPLLWGLYAVLAFQPLWWLWATAAYAVLALALNIAYPVLVFPFFYKTRPFTDEAQKKRLLEMVKKAGVKEVDNVVVGLESEKSVKPNAFFAGVGKTRHIVLFDTLLDAFTPDEIETVVAHELGHYVHQDIWRGLAAETLKVLAILYAVHALLPFALAPAGVSGAASPASMPLFLFLFGALDFLLSPLALWYARRMEAQADAFALKIAQKPLAQASTERRLADLALVDDRPPAWMEWLFFTHPATWRRIRMAETYKPPRQRKKP